MVRHADGRLDTIHIQTGSEVYIFETDSIVPNDIDALFESGVMDLKEVQGTAQGEGIETVWWDASEEPISWSSDPYELKSRADFVRSLGYTIGGKPKTKVRLTKV